MAETNRQNFGKPSMKKKSLLSLIAIALVGFLNPVFAEDPATEVDNAEAPAAHWARGIEAHADGRFDEAERAFSLHLGQGKVGAEVYYNLGLTQAAQGKTADAVLSYLRALAIDPQLGTARQALEQLAQQEGLPLPPLTQPRIWTGLFGSNPFWLTGSILGWVGLALLAWGLFRSRLRLPYIASGIILTLLAGASLGVAQLGDPLLADAGLAVVQSSNGKSLPLRGNPVDNSAALEQLKPGSVVELISARGRWILVSSLTGKSGWLPQESVTAVLPVNSPTEQD
jgi:tetratricopeptide (TPR) repeat protein